MLCARENPAREHAAQHAAVDGQSAAADVENFQRIVAECAPLEGDIIGAGADDGEGHDPQRQRKGRIRRKTVALFAAAHQQDGQQHAHGDQYAVPVDGKTEDGQRRARDFHDETRPPKRFLVKL